MGCKWVRLASFFNRMHDSGASRTIAMMMQLAYSFFWRGGVATTIAKSAWRSKTLVTAPSLAVEDASDRVSEQGLVRVCSPCSARRRSRSGASACAQHATVVFVCDSCLRVAYKPLRVHVA